MDPLLATTWQDWVERLGPVVLLLLGLAVLALRARERRRGPDDDDLL